MKKRLMSLLLSAAMVFSMVVVPTAAAETKASFSLTPSVEAAKPGDSVSVDVCLDSLSSEFGGSYGAQFRVAYDPDILEVVLVGGQPATVGSLWNPMMTMFGQPSSSVPGMNEVSCVLTNFAPMPGTEGVIATIEFKVKSDVPAGTTSTEVIFSNEEFKVFGVAVNNKNTNLMTTDRESVALNSGEIEILWPANVTTTEFDAANDQISTTEATVKATYTLLDGYSDADITEAGFNYGSNKENLNSKAAATAASGAFEANVTGAAESKLYYQAYVKVGEAFFYGDVQDLTLAGPKATKVTVDADTNTIVVPGTLQLTASVKDQFGGDYATAVTWAVTEAQGVSIDNNGLLTVDKTALDGTVEVTATAENATSEPFEITIDRPDPELKTLTITDPAAADVPTATVGTATVTLEATGIDQFDVSIPVTGVEWSIAETAGVSISGNVITITNKAAAGTVEITAQVGDITDTAILTINKAASKAASVVVTNDVATVEVPNSLQMTAQVFDQFGDAMTAATTWAVTEAQGVTISNDGLLTTDKTALDGTVKVTAKSGDAESEAFEVTVDRPDPELKTLTITDPAAADVPTAAVGTATVTLEATGIDQFDVSIPVTGVEWSISEAAGVSIDGNVITITNKAVAGTVEITAQVGDITDTATLTINKAPSEATAIVFEGVEDATTMTIPTTDTDNTKVFKTKVFDQFGDEMTGQTPAYEFKTADAFVSAADNTVTVKKGAVKGTEYTLTASINGVEKSITITVVDIMVEFPQITVDPDATYGDTWADIVTVAKGGSASLDGQPVKGEFVLLNADVKPNAGTQSTVVQFQSEDGNYKVDQPVNATINKKSIAAKWSGETEYTYGETVELTAAADVELTVSGNTESKASDTAYTATAAIKSDADKANYDLTNTTKEYTIAKATAKIEIADQIVKAGKDNDYLLGVIGTVKAEGVNGETIEGQLSIDGDISGKTPNTKPQTIAVIFTHEDANYVSPVKGSVQVTFTEGDPQIFAEITDTTLTYGESKEYPASLTTGTGALSYASSDENVITVDAATGKLTSVNAGKATITVTAAAVPGEYIETTKTYKVEVLAKEITVSGIKAENKSYNADTNAVLNYADAKVDGLVGTDAFTIQATGAFADANAGTGKTVTITDIKLTPVEGTKSANYVLTTETLSATADITKVESTQVAVGFDDLTQKPGSVDVKPVVKIDDKPVDITAEVVVEYQIVTPAVDCGNPDDPNCDHTDCGKADEVITWTTEAPQDKGEYQVRVYVKGDDNVPSIGWDGTNATDEAVVGTLVVKKTSSSGGGGSSSKPVEPEQPEQPAEKPEFDDVAESDWYYSAVIKAVEAGLFAGTDADSFSPDMSMNRAMMATVLAAMEFGAEGAPKADSDFTDLTADWYKNAVAWAAENKVTAGVSAAEYGPDLALTREQVAVFLYAYAQLKGVDVSVGEDTNILSFLDIADLSDWAIPAMQWAVGEGLLAGTPEGLLLPKTVATRAQVAVILVNFNELIND